MSYIKIRHKLNDKTIPEYARAAGIYPVLAYDKKDKFFLMDDKTCGFAWLCHPLLFADEKVQERANNMLNQDLPKHTGIQFISYRSPDINPQMHAMQALRLDHQHPLLSEIINEREKFFQQHTIHNLETRTRRGNYDLGLAQDLKLCITIKIPISSNTPTEAEVRDLVRLRTKFESSLRTVGLGPVIMDAEAYIRFMDTLINWDPGAPWRRDSSSYDEDVPICDQIHDYTTNFELESRGLKLGDTHVKVLSAKKLADKMYFGDALKYVGDLSGGDSRIKENYAIVVNIQIDDPDKNRSKLDRSRQWVVTQAYGPMLKFIPVLADKKAGFDALYDSMKEGNKPIKLSYSMVIFAPTRERAVAASQSASSIWREQRFELLEDRFMQLPMFINCMPFCADWQGLKELYRHKSLTTEHAVPVLPIFGEWKGTGTFHSVLMSRNSQVMSLSLHDSDTNKNAVVCAESGSGKSFLLNDLILSYLSEGAQVWVVDVGKSYQKLCSMLKGDFVHFAENAKISLNPFGLVDDWSEEEDGLVSLVSTMASAKGLLEEVQVAALKKIMSDLYAEHGPNMSVDHIAEICRSSTDLRVQDIGTQLHAFTKNGSYGKYFSAGNTIDFRNSFTVLELDELQGRKHLRQVVLLQLIYQIQQAVYLGDRSRKRVVIIDEAWDLLKEGEVAIFMEHAYRKFRKYGGSVLIATQSVNDLYENAVGRAIAENSANMYLLGQTAETVESIKATKRLSLPEFGYEMLKGVHTIKGVYSEIFIKSNAGTGIGRLIVSEFFKLLYSTDPEDVVAIDKYTNRGLSIAEAVRAVMRERNLAPEKEVA